MFFDYHVTEQPKKACFISIKWLFKMSKLRTYRPGQLWQLRHAWAVWFVYFLLVIPKIRDWSLTLRLVARITIRRDLVNLGQFLTLSKDMSPLWLISETDIRFNIVKFILILVIYSDLMGEWDLIEDSILEIPISLLLPSHVRWWP